MKNWKEIAIPARLADAPMDARGFPVTFTSIKLPDGRYDFTTADPRKWAYVVQENRCALCGKPHDEMKWFIGGPKCMQYRLFFDPPMHEECARYSFYVCPYLALPGYLGAKSRLIPDELRIELASSDKIKPQVFGLAVTDDYEIVEFQGDVLVHANEWCKPIEWWKDGMRFNATDYKNAGF